MEPFVCNDIVYDDIAIGLGNLFADECSGETDNFAGAAAAKLMTRQGMRIKSEIKENDTCIGWKAFWFDACEEGEAQKFDSVQSLPDCDFPAVDPQLECHEEVYGINCYITYTTSFKDFDCSSRFSGVDLSATKINEAIKKVRAQVAASVMDTMLACVRPNMYPKSQGCINGNMTEFTAAQFDAKLLNHFANIARQHGCRQEDMCILDDSNFYEYLMNLRDGQCCADQGDQRRVSRYDITSDMYLDAYTGRCSTYLVNPKCFGFINICRYKNTTPVEADSVGDSRRWVWSITDPLMSILEIDSDSGASVVRPICYDIEYKRECCERDARNLPVYKHSFFVTYTGGNYSAPDTGCGNGKCVFEFTNIGA